MRFKVAAIVFVCMMLAASSRGAQREHNKLHVGVDQNLYPGDDLLPKIRQHADFIGYWLNSPPGEKVNTWRGHREAVRRTGLGFLVLFNGRIDSNFNRMEPVATGKADALQAIQAAENEGFPAKTVIFLDMEEGGRLLPKSSKYVAAWVEVIEKSEFRAGVYCSGFEVEDDPGTMISTADDIHEKHKSVALWLANDGCPPAPGCSLQINKLKMSESGREDALVWQYAQSPARPDFAKRCMQTYARDGNCYLPDTPRDVDHSVDLDVSPAADPSGGR
jgi:hypothetical protein